MPENQNPTPAQIEMQDRLDLIADLMIKGLTEDDIIEYIDNKTDWNISDTEVLGYIKTTRLQFAKQAALINPQTEIVKAARRYELVYKQAIKQGDYQTALDAQKSLAALLKLDTKE